MEMTTRTGFNFIFDPEAAHIIMTSQAGAIL
jgi:inosine-uridine nucleoside N-ribohydrolase